MLKNIAQLIKVLVKTLITRLIEMLKRNLFFMKCSFICVKFVSGPKIFGVLKSSNPKS